MIIEQSILIELRTTKLDQFIESFSNVSTIHSSEVILENQWRATASISYNDVIYAFSVYAKPISPSIILINLDCIDQKFISLLEEQADDVLNYLLNLIHGSHISYWVLNASKDLEETYHRINTQQNIEICCIKRISS